MNAVHREQKQALLRYAEHLGEMSGFVLYSNPAQLASDSIECAIPIRFYVQIYKIS
jgi:hypothetical protein